MLEFSTQNFSFSRLSNFCTLRTQNDSQQQHYIDRSASIYRNPRLIFSTWESCNRFLLKDSNVFVFSNDSESLRIDRWRLNTTHTKKKHCRRSEQNQRKNQTEQKRSEDGRDKAKEVSKIEAVQAAGHENKRKISLRFFPFHSSRGLWWWGGGGGCTKLASASMRESHHIDLTSLSL